MIKYFSYNYVMKEMLKNKIVLILLFIIFCESLYIVVSHANTYDYDTVSQCVFVEKASGSYCKTKHIEYYNTNIYFKNDVLLSANDRKNVLTLSSLKSEDLKLVREKVKHKALWNTIKIKNLNKILLAQSVIKYRYYHDTNDINILFNDIVQITNVIDYISSANIVKPVTNEEQSLIPTELIKTDYEKIKYAAYYDGNIINYYTNNGELILKLYGTEQRPYRYQVYDDKGEFYTYDANKKLVEYSKSLGVYDSKDNLIYKVSESDIDIPYILKKQDRGSGRMKRMISSSRVDLNDNLDNPNTDIYKSIVKVIDAHYGASYEEMLFALESYFNELKVNNPKIYREYKNMLAKRALTINFAKIKAKIRNNYLNNYFYDIKINFYNGKIHCEEHPPCETCSRNVSVWAWKYPKTSIKK